MVTTERKVATGRCWRCGGVLVMRDEPGCATCGWADYTVRSTSEYRPKTATEMLDYVGAAPAMAGVAVVCALRVATSGREWLQPRCPWCNAWMVRDDVGGRRRKIQHRFWMCDQNHRIATDREGWR